MSTNSRFDGVFYAHTRLLYHAALITHSRLTCFYSAFGAKLSRVCARVQTY